MAITATGALHRPSGSSAAIGAPAFAPWAGLLVFLAAALLAAALQAAALQAAALQAATSTADAQQQDVAQQGD